MAVAALLMRFAPIWLSRVPGPPDGMGHQYDVFAAVGLVAELADVAFAFVFALGLLAVLRGPQTEHGASSSSGAGAPEAVAHDI